MQEALIGAVRITHIGSAIMLAGGGFLYTFVIAPTLAKRMAGPKIGEIMFHLGPQMGRYFTLLSYVVFLSGATLLTSIWGPDQVFKVLFGGGLYGSILLTGIVAFLAGFTVAEGVLMPTGKKMLALTPDSPPEIGARLAQRQWKAFVAIAVLDIIALSMMALAVNARA